MTRTGRTAEAIAHFEQVAKTAAGTVFGDLAAGFRHALMGHGEAARSAISPMTSAAGRADEAIARFLAQLYTIIGDGDAACTYLEHAVARGNLDYPSLARDPSYRDLQPLPRFQTLLADVKRRWKQFEV